ncbi:hypothetical protein [Virgifigura deserti]|uniref:hypothetical protein n=1 Tax=Virgifigura deserti TaxID=2268457 RepID=UPI003CCBFBF4
MMDTFRSGTIRCVILRDTEMFLELSPDLMTIQRRSLPPVNRPDAAKEKYPTAAGWFAKEC